MFLTKFKVLLLVVYLFDPIVIETTSVGYLRNQSTVLVVCQSRFCVIRHYILLSTAAVLILLVYLFDTIFLKIL